MSDDKILAEITRVILWDCSLLKLPRSQMKERICFVQRETDCCKVLWSTQPPVKPYHVICNTLAKKVFSWLI